VSESASLVHNIETTVRSGLQGTYQAHLAAFDLLAWHTSGEFYYLVDQALGTSYLPKWESCRTSAWFARHRDTGEVKVMSSACRLRWCSLCSSTRRAYITRNISAWIQAARYPKFLTLTLKHSDAPLSHQIDSLYGYFRKLRKAKLFKDHVPGGIWFFQIKRTKNTNQWHPHLHCIIEGDYVSHGKLSRLWDRITHGSKIVDIRLVRDPDKGAFEVARYASSPADLTTNKSADYVEIFESLHGRRACGTWGTAKNVNLRQPLATEKHKWDSLGSWSIVYEFQGKVAAADQIVRAWLTNSALPPDVSMHQTEQKGMNDAVNRVVDSSPKYLPGFYDKPP